MWAIYFCNCLPRENNLNVKNSPTLVTLIIGLAKRMTDALITADDPTGQPVQCNSVIATASES
jgi:hypothetical protein